MAVIVILITNLALSLGDAAIKGTSADFVLWQIFVLRSVIAIPVVLLAAKLRSRGAALAVKHPGWVAVRSLLLTSMWIAYHAALPHLALGIAAAAYYTLPIFIALFAAFFIGDRIAPLGWGAIALGLAGVVLILKPDASGFNGYILLPIASAIFYALAMILTRTKCRDEDPLILSLALNVSFIAVGLVATAISASFGAADGFLSGPWSEMGTQQWLAMALLAGATIAGSIGAAVAYQRARRPPSRSSISLMSDSPRPGACCSSGRHWMASRSSAWR